MRRTYNFICVPESRYAIRQHFVHFKTVNVVLEITMRHRVSQVLANPNGHIALINLPQVKNTKTRGLQQVKSVILQISTCSIISDHT